MKWKEALGKIHLILDNTVKKFKKDYDEYTSQISQEVFRKKPSLEPKSKYSNEFDKLLETGRKNEKIQLKINIEPNYRTLFCTPINKNIAVARNYQIKDYL